MSLKIDEGEYFRKLADLMPAKVSNADADGNVIYFNQRWLDYTGMNFEELKAFGYHKIMHPDELEGFQKLLQYAAETGQTISSEMRFLNRDGEYKWNLNIATPIFDESGKVKMWVGSTTDIEDQVNQKKILEALVQERTNELEKANHRLMLQNDEKEQRAIQLLNANKELIAFNYISSHDLQEPLRKVQVFTNMVLDNEGSNISTEGKYNLKRILSSTTKMRQLIDDLLAYSQIANTDDVFIETDLKALVNEVIDNLKEEIAEKNAVVNIAEMDKLRIIPFQFNQLFQNLFTNSLKFKSASRLLEISISSKIGAATFPDLPSFLLHKKLCHITFMDNGIGFDPEYKNRVFDVFKQFHKDSKIVGTGIGLSIVKKVVENHHGFISADSEVGVGTTFNIFIPV